MSIRQAAAKYNVSRLQISRWLERYKTGGIEALVGMKQKKRFCRINGGKPAKSGVADYSGCQ